MLAVAYYALTATYGRALELEEQKEKRLKQQKRLEKLQEAEPDHPSACMPTPTIGTTFVPH